MLHTMLYVICYLPIICYTLHSGGAHRGSVRGDAAQAEGSIQPLQATGCLYIYIYMYTYVCMYVCMYVCVYIYIYIYTHKPFVLLSVFVLFLLERLKTGPLGAAFYVSLSVLFPSHFVLRFFCRPLQVPGSGMLVTIVYTILVSIILVYVHISMHHAILNVIFGSRGTLY